MPACIQICGGSLSTGPSDMKVFSHIDYQVETPAIARMAREASIYKTTRFSDHAPLTIHYDLPL